MKAWSGPETRAWTGKGGRRAATNASSVLRSSGSSIDTDTKATSFRSRASAIRDGNSLTHGSHQVAHRVSTTGWPRWDATARPTPEASTSPARTAARRNAALTARRA